MDEKIKRPKENVKPEEQKILNLVFYSTLSKSDEIETPVNPPRLEETRDVTLEYFENLKNQVPLNDDGTTDIEKFKEIITTGDKNNPQLEYFFNKFPEYFTRGSVAFNLLLGFTSKNMHFTNIDDVINNISNGDFSEIIELDRVYANVIKLSELFKGRMHTLTYDFNQSLWKSKKVIPKSWEKDMEKYGEIYNEIVKNEGGFFYKDDYIFDPKQIDRLLENDNEENDKLKFARKVLSGYVSCQTTGNNNDNERVFKRIDTQLLDAEKGHQKERINKKRNLEKELNDVETRLEKFNFITSRLKKLERKELLDKKDKLSEEIASINRTIRICQSFIDNTESDKEFFENYREVYSQNLRSHVTPLLKKHVGKKCSIEEQADLMPIIDNISQSFFSVDYMLYKEREPLYALDEQFSSIIDEKYNDKFNNALSTISSIPNSVVEFGNLDNKDLYSLLGIIRNNLGKVATDTDHGKLDKEFRKKKIKEGTSPFFQDVAPVQYVDPLMKGLNVEFKELLNIEDTKEYIKEAGRLWYKFLLIHPYEDGNGRTGRHLLNIMMAHKGFAMKSMYKSITEQAKFESNLDQYVIGRYYEGKNAPNIEKVGNEFYIKVKDKLVDLSGKDRLKDTREIDER